MILFLTSLNAQQTLTVKVNEPKAEIQPTMWGVFFEDINLGADGGIYAELVKNRSFEFFKPLMGWTVHQKQFNEGAVLVVNRKEENTANPRFIRVTTGIRKQELNCMLNWLTVPGKILAALPLHQQRRGETGIKQKQVLLQMLQSPKQK